MKYAQRGSILLFAGCEVKEGRLKNISKYGMVCTEQFLLVVINKQEARLCQNGKARG